MPCRLHGGPAVRHRRTVARGQKEAQKLNLQALQILQQHQLADPVPMLPSLHGRPPASKHLRPD